MNRIVTGTGKCAFDLHTFRDRDEQQEEIRESD
jgi:hypothetical protein